MTTLVCWPYSVVNLGKQFVNGSILNSVETKDDGGHGGDSWSYKTCKTQSNCHHQHTNTQCTI